MLVDDTVDSGDTVTLPETSTIVYTSGTRDYLVISGSQFVVTGTNWNGAIVPPTLVS